MIPEIIIEEKEYIKKGDLIDFIGKEKYVKLLKEHNLCTKKWTRGRAKKFYEALNKIIKKEAYKVRKEMKQLEKDMGVA